MDGQLLVLVGRRLVVGIKEPESRGNVRARACFHPVDQPDNPLIHFGAAFEVGVVRGWVGNGVNRETRMPWSHIRDWVHAVSTEAMGSVVCESDLREVNREVAAWAPFPGEGRGKEVVNVAHEIKHYLSGQLLLEACLLGIVSGVKKLSTCMPT